MPSGESLAYDALGRLLSWQSAPGASATSTGAYAYDGAGERVWQQDVKTTSTSTTTTTMTYVLGGLQQVTTTAVSGQSPSTSTRSYYTLPGGVLATRTDNDNLIEQATDPLGTPLAALNAKTGLLGEQLRAPYGQLRYNAEASTNGGMHTALGFTGQREDAQAPGGSGLDYFHARYYDPSVGRILSADTARPGLGDPSAMDGYGYVGGMVESFIDPSGQWPQNLREWFVYAYLIINLLVQKVQVGLPEWAQRFRDALSGNSNQVTSIGPFDESSNGNPDAQTADAHTFMYYGDGPDTGGWDDNGGASGVPRNPFPGPRPSSGFRPPAQAKKKKEDPSHKVQQGRTSPGHPKYMQTTATPISAARAKEIELTEDTTWGPDPYRSTQIQQHLMQVNDGPGPYVDNPYQLHLIQLNDGDWESDPTQAWRWKNAEEWRREIDGTSSWQSPSWQSPGDWFFPARVPDTPVELVPVGSVGGPQRYSYS